jgi:hypothetical protein
MQRGYHQVDRVAKYRSVDFRALDFSHLYLDVEPR